MNWQWYKGVKLFFGGENFCASSLMMYDNWAEKEEEVEGLFHPLSVHLHYGIADSNEITRPQGSRPEVRNYTVSKQTRCNRVAFPNSQLDTSTGVQMDLNSTFCSKLQAVEVVFMAQIRHNFICIWNRFLFAVWTFLTVLEGLLTSHRYQRFFCLPVQSSVVKGGL